MTTKTNRRTVLATYIVLLISMTTAISIAGDAGEYYRINLLVETTSDWTQVEPLPPWNRNFNVVETRVINPEKDPHFKIGTKGGFGIKSQSYDATKKVVEFIVYFKAQTQDFEFTITKGDIGTTRVKALNTCSEDVYKMGTFTNSNSAGHPNPRKFKIALKKISKYGTVQLPRTR